MIVADDPVLREERAHLDVAERCLQGMRQAAADIGDYGVDALASESLGRVRAQRLKALAADPDAPPFFGRIDRDHERGKIETLHIGRRHIRDARGDPVVIDWRAPIARGFYRATPRDRMGVRLRRRFGIHAGTLSSFEDEHLDRGEALGLRSSLLREEIERPRVGPMRDIVATIQPDQDVPVRATEPAHIATLKGDARMAEVLRRAVQSHVRRPVEDLVPVVGTKRFRVPEHRLRRYVDDTRRADIRWTVARDRLRQQLAEDVRRQREDAGGAPSDAETAKVARSKAVREFVDTVWPPLDAAELLARL